MKKSFLFFVLFSANSLLLFGTQLNATDVALFKSPLKDSTVKMVFNNDESTVTHKVNAIGVYEILFEKNNGYTANTPTCGYQLLKFSEYFKADSAIVSWHTTNDSSITVFAGIQTSQYPFYDSSSVVSKTTTFQEINQLCSKFNDFIQMMTEKYMAASKLTVQPNPATNANLTLKFETPIEYIQKDAGKVLKIIDIKGNVVLEKQGELQGNIDLSNHPALKSGVYMAEVWFQEVKLTTKFVIQ